MRRLKKELVQGTEKHPTRRWISVVDEWKEAKKRGRGKRGRAPPPSFVCGGTKKSMMNDRRTDHKEGEKVTTHTRVD